MVRCGISPYDLPVQVLKKGQLVKKIRIAYYNLHLGVEKTVLACLLQQMVAQLAYLHPPKVRLRLFKKFTLIWTVLEDLKRI